ncbi:anoctamin-5 [Condylostylus longicornis]|uniref:anoctamin-5 n=1 Tax=Condylostylus longicornis TaxID=2530218 RepID=UPI00244DB879|nr:anoctamin-5 [Condylostylus longicornis]
MSNSDSDEKRNFFKILEKSSDENLSNEADEIANELNTTPVDESPEKCFNKLQWKDSFETGYDENSIERDLYFNSSGSHQNSSSHNDTINISRTAKRFFSSPAKVHAETLPISIIGTDSNSDSNINNQKQDSQTPIITIFSDNSNSNMNKKYNRARRFSQDSGIVTGKIYSDYNSDGLQQLSQSNDNLKSVQFFPDNKLRITATLNEEDSPMESPTINDVQTERLFTNNSLQNVALLSSSNENDSSRRSSFNGQTMTKVFGPKVGCELPGTAISNLELLRDTSSYEKLDSMSSSLIQEEMKFSDENLSIGRKFSVEKSEDNLSISGSFNSKKSKMTIEEVARRISKQDKEGLDPESLYFRDGRKKIDMILAWEEENEGVMTEQEAKRRENRKIFQENMLKEGLELELEDKSQSFDEKTFFLKIHLPWRLEQRYAEVLNLKLPIKRFITISVKAWEDENIVVRKLQVWTKLLSPLVNAFKNLITQSGPEEEATFKKATAGGNPEEQFIVKDRATSYTNAQRSLMVFQILLRMKFDETEKMGIRRLLNDGTYLACFPLHEGRYDKNHSKTGAKSDRRLLYLNWARPSQWYKKQPLCLIRKYFGDKIALYFCWLGFYTEMLIYPSIIGTLCFLYGLASMNSEDNIPSKEMCDKTGAGNITLCPLCDKACSYQNLHDSCLFATLTYLFDNPATVFFAIFMSFWATTFLELWKRKQSVVVWEWDLGDIDQDEDYRPEFETNATTFRTNPVTREKEPYMSTTTRAFRFVVTSTAVLFMIAIVLSAVLGTIIYRISILALIHSGSDFFVKSHAKLFTSISAALINLVVIMILTKFYHRLAIHLTNLENPRTHTEYEDSYTFKIFFFEFMNFYSSLIYIAFFKGRFFDYPGDDIARQSEFFRLKNDICDPAGCLSELCIQLAIIMVGKQCWNNFMEYLFPKFWNWWRQRQHKAATKDVTHLHMAWEQDYHMQDPGRLALFDEYLEMILQYGFVTLFVAAFPLAPLFALLNNIAEIRLDAFKMVTQARRPLAERVTDIGAWYGILRIITYTAVVSNGFVIAYTSDFIPRMVYKLMYSDDKTLRGYISHSMSYFNTTDYKEEWGNKGEKDPDICRYRGYRANQTNPNNPHADPYELTSVYWHVFAARLAFVVVFEHIVFIVTGFMQFVIPDIPAEVKTQIQRETLLAKEAKLQHGLKKARQDDDLLSILKASTDAGFRSRGSSWARRLSRLGDGLEAHVEVSKPRRSVESTVWEVA